MVTHRTAASHNLLPSTGTCHLTSSLSLLPFSNHSLSLLSFLNCTAHSHPPLKPHGTLPLPPISNRMAHHQCPPSNPAHCLFLPSQNYGPYHFKLHTYPKCKLGISHSPPLTGWWAFLNARRSAKHGSMKVHTLTPPYYLLLFSSESSSSLSPPRCPPL